MSQSAVVGQGWHPLRYMCRREGEVPSSTPSVRVNRTMPVSKEAEDAKPLALELVERGMCGLQFCGTHRCKLEAVVPPLSRQEEWQGMLLVL
jgi:hypothetical protein